MHNMINYSEIKEKIETSDSPFLFLFGTGWGLTEEVLIKSDYIAFCNPSSPASIKKRIV